MTIIGTSIRALVAVVAATGIAYAQPASDFPSKPVRIVVPYPAGGSGDIVARAIAQKMTDAWGQSVLVDNRPGANGNIGTEYVAKAAPDGYVLLMATDIQFSISPAVFTKLPYDPEKDFSPISLVTFSPNILTAHPSLEANNVSELIALAKRHPGKINYASTGAGSTHHLSVELLKALGGFNVTHIPYKGSSQALPDLVSGQVQLMFLGIPQTLPHVNAGRLKIIAIGSPQRLSVLPNVPTIAESGFPGYEATNWWALYGPSGISAAIVAKVQTELVRVLSLADIRERFLASGLTPLGSTPDELSARMRDDRQKWKDVIRKTGIRVEQR